MPLHGAEKLAKGAKSFDVDAIVRQRVWDEAFDDVERKAAVRPADRPQGAEDDAVETLNFEKSRVGLGDIYAKQYEAEIFGAKTEGEVKEDKEKTETKALFAKLMHKLDLLTNSHFTPRAPTPGLSGEQLSKVSSLKMEETIPLLISDTTLRAPEELKAPRRHEKDHEELAHDERVALRRAKKARRRKGIEGKMESGEMTLSGKRARDKKLAEKNAEAKKEKAAKFVAKEAKKRIKSTELLSQAASNAAGDASRKEEARKQRQERPDGNDGSPLSRLAWIRRGHVPVGGLGNHHVRKERLELLKIVQGRGIVLVGFRQEQIGRGVAGPNDHNQACVFVYNNLRIAIGAGVGFGAPVQEASAAL